MAEPGGDFDLAQEPLGTERLRQPGFRTLMATWRRCGRYLASKPTAMPPRPSSPTTSYAH
jgi:hypothetical protein